jgi:hypothetical protein
MASKTLCSLSAAPPLAHPESPVSLSPEQAVIFAWDALTATHQRWRHLTSDRFRVEIMGFW